MALTAVRSASCETRGYDASEHRARQFTPGSVRAAYDLVLAADEGHSRPIAGHGPARPPIAKKIRLLPCVVDAEAVELALDS